MGDADLVLEVKGEELAFSGPPITLKIRVEDSKTFTVEATKVSQGVSHGAAVDLEGRQRLTQFES